MHQQEYVQAFGHLAAQSSRGAGSRSIESCGAGGDGPLFQQRLDDLTTDNDAHVDEDFSQGTCAMTLATQRLAQLIPIDAALMQENLA